MFWDDWSVKCDNESVDVSLGVRIDAQCNVEYVPDPLGTQLSQYLFFVAVNKWSTPDDSLAGIESPVRAGCCVLSDKIESESDIYTVVEILRQYFCDSFGGGSLYSLWPLLSVDDNLYGKRWMTNVLLKISPQSFFSTLVKCIHSSLDLLYTL